MKITLATFLILLTTMTAVSADAATFQCRPLTDGEMIAAIGADFWGGLVCGAAVAGTLVGAATVITALGAGTTISLGIAFGISAATHVSALCLMAE